MNTVDSVGFFESLSFIGWLGILVWIGFVTIVLWKPLWFVNYDERFPKSKIFNDILYEHWHYILFMIIRFILIVIILIVITRIMFIL